MQPNSFFFWLVLFLGLLKGSLTSKSSAYCCLCRSRQHVFAFHLKNDNTKTIKTLIDEHLGAATRMKQYFQLLLNFVENDVNFILSEDENREDRSFMLLDVFRILLSSYREKRNASLKSITGLIDGIADAMVKISSDRVRQAFQSIFEWEFNVSRATVGCLTSGSMLFDQCSMCDDESIHDFLEHVRLFKFDHSFKMMARNSLNRSDSPRKYFHYIRQVKNFVSWGMNTIMTESSNYRDALVTIFNQLLEAFMENHSCMTIYQNFFISELQTSVPLIQDDSLQASVLASINRSLGNNLASEKNLVLEHVSHEGVSQTSNMQNSPSSKTFFIEK